MAKSILPISQLSFLLSSSKRLPLQPLGPTKCFFSSSSTPFPLQYDMIISRPSCRGPTTPASTTKLPLPHSKPTESSDSDTPESPPEQLSFEDWVDKKLIDKSKRKYYKKREKRMYGGADSDDERRKMREKSEFVELKPEIVELRTLHKREEELYFYDTFAFPWEKDKHYKMVYQLEKKYFPEHSLDKAFLEPGQSNSSSNHVKKKRAAKGEGDKGLVFFDDDDGGDGIGGSGSGGGSNHIHDVNDLSEKKVEEFFKCLKKVPDKNVQVLKDSGEPFLASRKSGLPHKWDSPAGTVVLVNKPKGVSFLCFSSF